LKIPCGKLQGIFNRKECGLFYDSNALAFAVQPLGRIGRCPAGGTASTGRLNGIFLEETKRSRLAIVADVRRGHCFGGLILVVSALPLTLNAGDAPGVLRSRARPALAQAAVSLSFR